MMTPIFHLAFPVRDLQAARSFYKDVLGARVGRTGDGWLDLFLWGAQITLHQRPEDVPESSGHGIRHFGVTLNWEEWEQMADALSRSDVPFIAPPKVSFTGTPREQAKLVVADPSGNRIELKAYRDPASALQY